MVQGLRPLPRRVGGPHHWMVRQSSHLAAVLLEELDCAAAYTTAPPVHLLLPKEDTTLPVPNEGGVLESDVRSMRALQQVKEVVWDSLAVRTRDHTPLAGACEVVPMRKAHHGPTHRDLLRTRDGHHPTMQVMRRWR